MTIFQVLTMAYSSVKDELLDARLEFLDKSFNTVDSVSLNEYIKPDYSRLTDTVSVDEELPDSSTVSVRGLLSVKTGIRPHLREVENQA